MKQPPQRTRSAGFAADRSGTAQSVVIVDLAAGPRHGPSFDGLAGADLDLGVLTTGGIHQGVERRRRRGAGHTQRSGPGGCGRSTDDATRSVPNRAPEHRGRDTRDHATRRPQRSRSGVRPHQTTAPRASISRPVRSSCRNLGRHRPASPRCATNVRNPSSDSARALASRSRTSSREVPPRAPLSPATGDGGRGQRCGHGRISGERRSPAEPEAGTAHPHRGAPAR